MSLISFLFFLPLFGSLICAFIPHWNHRWIRAVALYTSLFAFLFSLFLWIFFDNSTGRFQFGPYKSVDEGVSGEFFGGDVVAEFSSLERYSAGVELNEISSLFAYGIDGISLFFIILTTFLIPICLLVGWTSIGVLVKEYSVAFLLLESLLIAAFSVLDLILFYIFFESVLLPMFLIIGVWGSRERKIRAAYQFFLYTLIGSLLMLLGILLIYCQGGSTDVQLLYTIPFSETRQLYLWIAFFASFAVKLPMVPVHIWLPEAHVEAPTAGSVILAGILLKLGGYGFLRFSLPLFPMGSLYFTPLVHTLSIVAIIYTSLTTLRQIDLKKIIAYSSVAHMNFVTLGLFSLNPQGIEGGLLLMIAHGLVSPALFLCVGFLYDRYKTRLLHYYGGCCRTMPLFSLAFLFFTLANISLPGTSNFVGEFLVLTGGFQNNTLVATLGGTGMILGAGYALWLCNRLLFGLGKPYYISSYTDLSRRESFLLLPFLFAVLFLGVLPQSFLDTIHSSVIYNLLLTG
jgi:proton-translocating NADH-quinone oxidoreductase chain M